MAKSTAAAQEFTGGSKADACIVHESRDCRFERKIQSKSEDQENLTQNVSNEDTSEKKQEESGYQQVLKYSELQFKFEDWKGPNMKGWEAAFGEDVDPPNLVIFSYCVFEAKEKDRNAGYAFYQDVISQVKEPEKVDVRGAESFVSSYRQLKVGSIVVIVDVLHRSKVYLDELYEALAAQIEADRPKESTSISLVSTRMTYRQKRMSLACRIALLQRVTSNSKLCYWREDRVMLQLNDNFGPCRPFLAAGAF
eukprot:768351-Hanusia_phi.AAC.13